MHSPVAYVVVAGVGLLLAHVLTRDPDAGHLRFLKLVLVPAAFVAALAMLPKPGVGAESIGSLMGFFVVMGFLAILLAPNIGHFFGAALSNFIDPQDWTPAEEEIALRPVVKLIDKDQFQDALEELEKLLKKHKPTYEALQLKAKLLNHFQRIDQTVATLLKMIRLSHTAHQQVIVMELLDGVDRYQSSPSNLPAPGIRQIWINHELVLFQPGNGDRSVNKAIPAGVYDVQEINSGRQRWLVLKDEPWGNAETYWEAVKQPEQPAQAPAKTGILSRLTTGLKRKNWRQSKEASRALYKQASQLLRQNDWEKAFPLLQEATAEDPHNYEIAYRFVQAAFRAGPSSNPNATLRKVLTQSRWTEDQERMLNQLKS
jgi:tetratricopeptide (TPR) repeat protein